MTLPDRVLAAADDPDIVVGAEGLLAVFNDAGVLAPLDVLSAMTIARIEGEDNPDVLLAAALAVRGTTRYGHVCIRLRSQRDAVVVDGLEAISTDSLPWPDPASWDVAVARSDMVGDGGEDRPLVLVGNRLYLQRYYGYEQRVAQFIRDRMQVDPTPLAADAEILLDKAFSTEAPGPSQQRVAAGFALSSRFVVIAGGPGTGKTHTIVAMLAALARSDGKFPLVALAAPTGKAAARLGEAVIAESVDLDARATERLGSVGASTIHRLLGYHPARGRFRHDADNRLPHDIVIIDEMSMVSLPLAARLLAAMRDDAAVVLVGDPNQLESIEAGTVLADIVGQAGSENTSDVSEYEPPIASRVIVLDRGHRYAESGGIADLAAAIRRGDGDKAIQLLSSGSRDLGWVSDVSSEAFNIMLARVVAHRIRLVEIAMEEGRISDALDELGQMAILSAHHQGPDSVDHWRRRVEDALDERFGGLRLSGEWYPGQPIMITANDYMLELYNGDIGVTVTTPDGLRVAFRRGDIRMFPRSHIGDHTTVHAMTIHKSQGSGFKEVVVALPSESSRLLTRELFYTAVTRATDRVTIIGDEDVVRQAINRSVERASGLGSLLWGSNS